jgi:hypothetical protein
MIKQKATLLMVSLGSRERSTLTYASWLKMKNEMIRQIMI